MIRMPRTTIELNEAQDTRLRKIAQNRGVPVDSVLGDAVELYLRSAGDGIPDAAAEPSLQDPLSALVGLIADPGAPTDGSVTLDRSLYGR
jgi:hypothetical protein